MNSIHNLNINGVIKAFDKTEHQFIFLSLENFGLGTFFCKAI